MSDLAEKNHHFAFDQLMRLLGTDDRLSQAVYRPLWYSRVARVTKAIYSWGFLPRVFAPGGGSFLLRGIGEVIDGGEVLLSEARIAQTALRCAVLAKPFLIARTRGPRPILRVCEMLGVDACNELRCYISGNRLLVFFAEQQGQPVVVHLAASVEAAKDLELHRAGLECAAAALSAVPAGRLLPAVLSAVERGDYAALTQTRLHGATPLFERATVDEFYEVINRAFEPLIDFRASAVTSEGGADWKLIFERFPAVLAEFPQLQEVFGPLLQRLQKWQRERGLPSILTHGDYWPRNILFDESSGQVTGIIDWEWSRRDGTPGLDALQLAFFTAVEFEREITEYFAQAWSGEWEDPRLAAYVMRIREGYELTEIDVGYLVAMLCFDELDKRQKTGRVEQTGFIGKLFGLSTVLEAWLSRLP